MSGKLTLVDILEFQARHSEESPAIVIPGESRSLVESLSFSDVCEGIQKHQEWLQQRIAETSIECDVISDVVVAYLSFNSVDMLLSMLACAMTIDSRDAHQQQVAALLNIRWSPQEMSNALCSQKPHEALTILLYGDGFKEMANKVSKNIGHVTVCLPIPKFSLDLLRPRVFHQNGKSTSSSSHHQLEVTIKTIEENSDERDAFIVFTSGTTGGSKGVRLSHRAIAIQSLAKLSTPCHYTSATVMLASTVPLFHIGGISSCLAVLFAGGTLSFPSSSEARFDPKWTKASLGHPIFPTNTLVVVPAMLVALLSELDDSPIYPAVQLILIGGQSASQPLINKLMKIFPNARIVQTYACTEAASSLTFVHINSVDKGQTVDANASTGDCVGRPPAHVHIRLYRKEGKVTKIVTLPYIPGLIATRGPHVMTGYWSRGAVDPSDKTKGWYVTSDLGFFDEKGQLYFCGRARDVIRSGGETVMAQEVERVLLQNPDVVECAVFAKKDDRFGEAVACALVTSKPLSRNSIKQWCGQQGLASYKRPRFIFQVDQLPRNSSGKVLKHELIKDFGNMPSKL